MDIATGADNAKRDNLEVLAYLLNEGGHFEGKLTCLIFKDETRQVLHWPRSTPWR